MSLERLTADNIETPHGFFTRKGGASSGLFAGLNCGPGSSDQSEIVRINRARVAGAMEVEEDHLITVRQIHSAKVHVIDAPNPERPRGDAMVSDTPGIALAVLTADCQPVLLYDPVAKVIGAAHAGWRGAMGGVLKATLEAMETLGASRETTHAAIGPAISQRNYEVGPEFLDDFLADDPGNKRFFVNGNGGRYLFDLPGYGLHRLRSAGISRAEWIGHCTYADPERFYSYRRSTHAKESDYGRLISVIRL